MGSSGLLTNPRTFFPIMVMVLGAILWINIVGASIPSAMLAKLLVDDGHALLSRWMACISPPPGSSP